jgi:hypothetical protein
MTDRKNIIHPRRFDHEEAFVAARMDAASMTLPPVLHMDDWATATAKRARIAQAREDAREDARDEWAAWMDDVVETYERGLGAAWA